MPLSRVQVTPKVNNNGASVALPFPSPPTVGNGVVVLVNTWATVPLSVVDNRGNPYGLAITRALVSGGGTTNVYWCPAITATGSPFTVTVNGSGIWYSALAVEVSGVGTGLTIDQVVGSTGSGLTPATGSAPALSTVADSFQVAVLALGAGQATITVGSAGGVWTQEWEEFGVTFVPGEGDTRVVAGAAGTTPSAGWTVSASGQWATVLVAFKAGASAALTPYQSAVVAAGASQFWPLDDTVGSLTARNLAPGGVAATVQGTVVFGVPGPSGPATGARFLAADAADYLNAGVLTIPQVVTFEAWQLAHFGYTQQEMWFSNRTNNAGGVANGIFTGLISGTNSRAFGQANLDSLFGTSKLTDDKWHYVVVVFTATTITVYVDGKQEATGPETRPAANAGGTVTLGGHDDLGPSFWNGDLANIAIYGRALTPSEIAGHYGAMVGTARPRPVGPPFNRYQPLTPSDTVNLETPAVGLYIGAGGDVTVVEPDGLVRTFAAVPTGVILAVQAIRVMATGTTAGAIVALNRV